MGNRSLLRRALALVGFGGEHVVRGSNPRRWVVATAIWCAVGCSSAHPKAGGAGASGSGGHGSTGSTGGAPSSTGSGTSGGSDGGVGSDAGDGGPPCGDRNLGVVETYPPSFFIQNGGRIYNVMSPPDSTLRAAKGDGVTDDTQALVDAWEYLKDQFATHGSWAYAGGFVIYLPAGTYLVSDTIIYPGASLEAPTGYDWIDVVDVRFAGESRETSILKLADNAPGFGDPTTPKVVLAFQHPDTRFNNIPGNNALRNLTVDTGSGNPGAAAVFFQGANLTAMTNVLVRSGDGAGSYGFWMKIGSAQGAYRDLTALGFDYGIYQAEAGEVDTSFEHVTMQGQHKAALSAGGGMSVRDACVDESATGAQAGVTQPHGAQLAVLDSRFKGAPTVTAFETIADPDDGDCGGPCPPGATPNQSMYLRNVAVPGYQNAVVTAGSVAVTGNMVDEWCALPTVTLFDGGAGKTLGLPIEDSPLVGWYDPTTDWANVDDYGAVGDGKTDDSAAVQMAMASGKPVVVFRKAAYALSKAITIPASVKRVDILYADIGQYGSFTVAEASSDPLLIERGGAYGLVELAAARPVVVREMSTHFRNTATAATKVYLENVANVGGDDQFAPVMQAMWARGLNDELAGPATGDFVINGGTAWIFNYKTENKPVTSLLAEQGARVEVWNGYVNSTVDAGAVPMIVNDRSQMSFIGFTNLGSYVWGTSIQEVRDGGTESVPQSALPPRGDYTTDVFIPLYVGDAR